MRFEINWDLSKAEFREQVDKMISDARKNETVLVLPFHIGDNSADIMALILSQMNCEGCDASCCKTPKFAEFGIPFLKKDLEKLEKRIGKEKYKKLDIKSMGNNTYIATPCPFLHKNRCTIHDIRPFACFSYPFDKPGTDNSGEQLVGLDSLCPEVRRITKRIYMILWEMYNRRQEVITQRAEIMDGVQQEEMMRIIKKLETKEDKG